MFYNSYFTLSGIIILLVDDKILYISWEVGLIPIQLVLVIFLIYFFGALCYAYQKHVASVNYPFWNLSWFVVLFYAPFCFVVLLFKIYLTSFLLKIVLSTNVVVLLVLVLALQFFPEELIILNLHSFHEKRYTRYRVHQRHFVSDYDSKICRRKVEWKREECLLCEADATIVEINCGHLILCKKCLAKSKKIPTCRICYQYSIGKIMIKYSSSDIR